MFSGVRYFMGLRAIELLSYSSLQVDLVKQWSVGFNNYAH